MKRTALFLLSLALLLTFSVGTMEASSSGTAQAEASDPIAQINLRYRTDSGFQLNTFVLSSDGTFVDDNDATGTFTYNQMEKRFRFVYNAGSACGAVFTGELDLDRSISGIYRCQDGSNQRGFWYGQFSLLSAPVTRGLVN